MIQNHQKKKKLWNSVVEKMDNSSLVKRIVEIVKKISNNLGITEEEGMTYLLNEFLISNIQENRDTSYLTSIISSGDTSVFKSGILSSSSIMGDIDLDVKNDRNKIKKHILQDMNNKSENQFKYLKMFYNFLLEKLTNNDYLSSRLFKEKFDMTNQKKNFWFNENVDTTGNLGGELNKNLINSEFIEDDGKLLDFLVDWDTIKIEDNNFEEIIRPNIEGVNNYRKQFGGTNENKLKILSGMLCQYENPKIIAPKILSACIFDTKYNKKPQSGGATTTNRLVGIPKDITVYAGALHDAIKELLYRFKDSNEYALRIYIDDSISRSSNDEVIKMLNLARSNPKKINIINVKMNLFLDSNNSSHIGLLGTLFRFHTLMDPDVEKCFICEVDNFFTNSLIQILEDFFSKPNETAILTFRPHLYKRKNLLNLCIPNFFAGMFGFKKPAGKIVNPKLWRNLFIYADKLFTAFKNKQLAPNCPPNNDIRPGNAPFEFGFEEVALANVVIANFVLSKLPVYTVPVYWYAPMNIISIVIENMKERFSLLTEEFRLYVKEILHLNIDLFSENILTFHLFDNNLHILSIIENFLFKYLKENVNKIKISDTFSKNSIFLKNKENIKIFKNNEDMNRYKRLTGNTILFIIYPGYEINLEAIELTKMVERLNKNSPLRNDIKDLDLFASSHTINAQIYNLASVYCVFKE